VQVEAGRGYWDKAARDALFALLGAGVLVAAAPAKRRKALGVLAILAVLALFLWRRLQTATESSQVAAPEWERETDPVEVAVEEPVAEAAVEEAPVEETVTEETAVTEEAVVDEVAVDAETETASAETEAALVEAPADQPSEFEALDAALTALIGELERVEASRLEEVRIEEAQRAWREAQAEEAREHEEAVAREREEEAALVHSGRQLVHAGGSDSGGGYDSGDHDTDEGFQLSEDAVFQLPEAEVDEEAQADEVVEDEAAVAYAEPWSPAPVEEAPVDADEVVPQAGTDAPAGEAVAPAVEPARQRQATHHHGGLIGMIGRYSHREPGVASAEPPVATFLASAPAPEVEHAPPPAVEAEPEAAKPAPVESDWL
jgi:hypothetical protein